MRIGTKGPMRTDASGVTIGIMNRRTVAVSAAAIALLGLAACGGGDTDNTDSGNVIDPDYEWQTSLGCDVIGTVQTDELFVKDKYVCQLPGPDTNVYTFADSEARDNWREVAEDFGTVVLGEGETWLEVKS